MKLIRVFALIAAFAALGGCATNFVRPASESLTLGKSSRADIIKLAGKPAMQNDNATINGEKTQVLRYFYSDGAKFWGLIIPQRKLTYTLFNDTLVGEEFNSTMDGEKTEFDTDKIVSIQKGKTTRDEVIALMGKPSGEVIYPVVKDKNGTGLVYVYTYGRFAGMLTSFKIYRLVVTLGDNNIVTDISYQEDRVFSYAAQIES